MQNRQTFLGSWEHFRQVNGITMRIASSLPADKLDSHPITNMRTPKELLVHMYGMIVKNITLGITTSEIGNLDEKAIVDGLKTKDALIHYCLECWQAADKAAKTVTDEQLKGTVQTPWDMTMPGWMCATVIHDEYFHHRGQLYAFTRALGVAPPMVWDFGNNEGVFRPQEAAKA